MKPGNRHLPLNAAVSIPAGLKLTLKDKKRTCAKHKFVVKKAVFLSREAFFG